MTFQAWVPARSIAHRKGGDEANELPTFGAQQQQNLWTHYLTKIFGPG